MVSQKAFKKRGVTMSVKLKHQGHENPKAKEGQSPAGASNVVPFPTKCIAEGCSKKPSRMSFCSEHYDWFKFGLITKEGKKPIDFDKKLMAYQRKHAA